ncbi:DNA repair protein RecO [Parachitinimonas caeni]|uniref:DNA repair protein RecO n=1 Tax=Parachitinimonas caeni TaxID=3031301 RepID=A0ABT7DWP1_9NEIS|nr:DNA repair protein RecO [Parachitinimonas caeni]MDK2124239.1 DNA repair protein RecO [Parachitinimonas caeni]
MATSKRVESASTFLLHHYPYRETSLIIDVFSREHGRHSLVARGARRPRAALRGLLLAFQPLLLSWFGNNELKTLHSAEWQGGVPQLTGRALMCGFYLNELLIKLLPREDPHPEIFDAYEKAIKALARGASSELEPTLRCFELALLAGLGYAPTLQLDSTGKPIEASRSYCFVPEQGAHAEIRIETGVTIAGQSLLDMAVGDYRSPLTLQQSKLLMRSLLTQLLGDAPLYTRRLLQDLQSL